MVRKTITVYLDEDAYKRLRELIKPKKISQELDMLIKRRIAELEGREYNPLEEADYEALKREHNRLVREAEKLRRHLKRRKVYNQLLNLTFNCGMKEDLSNLDEVTPEILDGWDGWKEDAHQFITLLETIRSKREIERKLEEIRKSN
ncbi:MAG: hypothetical protein ACTSXC_07420 [Candidatus Freyarchaeota archaeon]